MYTYILQSKTCAISFKRKSWRRAHEITGERSYIYPVKHSELADPIVVVPKADNSVHLPVCEDYKETVNRVISEEQYLLLNTDDMFASIAGDRKFAKLDLRKANSQVERESDLVNNNKQ